ncbi:MAG TPA: hypothetical protein VL576_00835 [Candidatus Paceibacterota bacterium]|jgi:hypothetical protein|nr:hypothetical protein [Candidatus Paceibacterota bacterium]
MKNLLFALLALMVIIIASCSKKEEVIPQSPVYSQRLVMSHHQMDSAMQANTGKQFTMHNFLSRRKRAARLASLTDSMKRCVVEIGLTKDSTTNQYIRDEIALAHDSTAHVGYIAGEDAIRFPGFGAAALAAKAQDTVSKDTIPESVDVRPYKAYEKIPLYAAVKQDGHYVLFVDPRENTLPTKGGQLWLHDKMRARKDSVRLDIAPYYFDVNAADPTLPPLATRFSVSFCVKKFK